jgi:UDP-N-acetylmuramoyl-L-alanyl-D-glutamate--2,6-diaminopimelate ligase
MTIQLRQLIQEIGIIAPDVSELEIQGIAYDSRQVRPGFLFVALRGHAMDGHRFIQDAIQNGAIAVVGEHFHGLDRSHGGGTPVAMFQVENSRQALARIAAAFFNRPFEGMNLMGITGTNGKTTTSYVLESILMAAGAKPGVIGTINYRYSDRIWPAPVTTPESLELMQTLRTMADSGVSDVVMEVSSHALDQGRVEGCPFRVAIFTNLSRDHLDYHGSMEAYFEAKSLLFRGLKEKGAGARTRAVINTDDPAGRRLAGIADVPMMSYGLSEICDVRAEQVRSSRRGLAARLITPAGNIDLEAALIGSFNLYNILAASAAALCLEIGLEAISSGIARLRGVPGRLEVVRNKRMLMIVVDYAHTPDALLKALTATRSLAEGGRLITVFGCGGDRDKGKRREMGALAGEYSDSVVITSDNPRTEDPEVIIAQIIEGIRETGLKNLGSSFSVGADKTGYIVEPDREKAIKKAIEIADKHDIVLIAGKGHEDYQIIGKTKRHFDDREIASEAAR